MLTALYGVRTDYKAGTSTSQPRAGTANMMHAAAFASQKRSQRHSLVGQRSFVPKDSGS
jgi:hypothetical protein